MSDRNGLYNVYLLLNLLFRERLTPSQMSAVIKKLGGKEGATKFLSGEYFVQRVAVSTPTPEEFSTSPIVQVDVSAPVYPPWVKRVIHEDFMFLVRTEFSLETDVEVWRYSQQEKEVWPGTTSGITVYAMLKNTGRLRDCLSLQEGLAIRKKGGMYLRSHFGVSDPFKLPADSQVTEEMVQNRFLKLNNLYLWKSVVQHVKGDLYVPRLCEPSIGRKGADGTVEYEQVLGQVVVEYSRLKDILCYVDYALMYKI